MRIPQFELCYTNQTRNLSPSKSVAFQLTNIYCWKKDVHPRNTEKKQTPGKLSGAETKWLFHQWSFLVPLIGGGYHIITQLAVYTTYIPLIYCQLGDYIYHLPPIKGTRKLHWFHFQVERRKFCLHRDSSVSQLYQLLWCRPTGTKIWGTFAIPKPSMGLVYLPPFGWF